MYKLFLYTLLLAPIPFGANRPWAWSLYAVIVAFFGLGGCLTTLFNPKDKPLLIKPVSISIWLLIIPVTWILLQLCDFVPDAWIHPLWKLTAEQLSIPVKGYISLSPIDTGAALMKLLSYFLVFLISLQFNRSTDNTIHTFNSLAYVGLIYAVYGLVIYLGGFNTILWFERWASMDAVTSTFVNRNSYATYAGLTLLASFPLMFEKVHSCLQYGLKNNFGRQYFFEHVFIRGWFPLLLIVTITTALFLTQSRGGFLSTALAVIGFFIVLLLTRKIKNNRIIMILLGFIGLLSWGVMMRSGDKLLDRLDATDPENEGRLLVYNLLNKANQQNSAFGVGYGSFEHTFRLYRDETIVGFYDKAHNTYLENIFELGLIQASLLFLAIAIVAFVCLRGVWIRKRNWIYPTVGFSASLLVGAHALVDFSLQIPAVSYTYALIMGAAVAQTISSRKS